MCRLGRTRRKKDETTSGVGRLERTKRGGLKGHSTPFCSCLFAKKGEDRGYKNVTLETIMNTKADKAVKKITHHVTQSNDIYKETNRVEPGETLKNFVGLFAAE